MSNENALHDNNQVKSLLVERDDGSLETERVRGNSKGAIHTLNAGYSSEGSFMADAFGRFRTSSPYTLFDSKALRDAAVLFYDDQEVSGSGTSSTHQTNKASVKLSVGATTAGKRVRQSKARGNYQPGKSQLVIMTVIAGACGTGLKKQWGYFDARNGLGFQIDAGTFGIFSRTYTSGSAVDTVVTQSNFNVDPLDGTGSSGYTYDETKSTIFWIDFEWLGVGAVRFGVVDSGAYIHCHTITNSQTLTTSDIVYMSIPNLPVSWSIENDGTGAAADIYAICSTIISEGGQEETTVSHYVSRDGTSITLANQDLYTPIISFRLKSSANSGTAPDVSGICATVVPDNIEVAITTANVNYEWRLYINPTVASTDNASWVNATNAPFQYDVSRTNANTLTGGHIIAGGYGATTNQSRIPVGAAARSFLTMGSNIDFTTDELVLGVANIEGNGGTAYGGISLKEFC